jgi:hypothetical protein
VIRPGGRFAAGQSRRHRSPRGQALVEFALALPIFLLIVFGAIDVGRYVYGHSTLSQAAREGARLGAVEAYWVGRGNPLSPTYDASCNQPGGPVCPADVAALRADILAATNRMLTPFNSIVSADLFTKCDPAPPPAGWTDQTCNPLYAKGGNFVSVRVLMNLTPMTPVISQLIPTISMEASASMVIN